MKRLSFIIPLVLLGLFVINAFAATDLNSEMDALGANRDLMKKAKAIDPDNRMRVVQNREVDRNLRLEIGINYGAYATGNDPYVNTTTFGGQLDFHINPRWSFGARYQGYNNNMNAEGKAVYDDANNRIAHNEQGVRVPGYTYAKDSWLVVGDWYPIYGKLNMFDAGVVHFDVYVVGGAGQIDLGTGTSPLYSAGGGVGFWLSQHVTSRLEARWQGYKENVWDGSQMQNRDMNETVLTASIGFLL